nr:hypothetical protein CFP56_04943 [Quercus suber]
MTNGGGDTSRPIPFFVLDHSLSGFHFLTLVCVGFWLSIATKASLLYKGTPNPKFWRFKVEIFVEEDCNDH